jgi:hypothetical protein
MNIRFGARPIHQLGVLSLLLCVVMIIGCGAKIAGFDQTALQNAVSLKTEALALMDKATEPYADHKDATDKFMLAVDKASKHSASIPNNELSTKQWEILKDPEKNLLGGFIARWKDKGTLSAFFVNEAKGLVSDGFDEIISLENAKKE